MTEQRATVQVEVETVEQLLELVEPMVDAGPQFAALYGKLLEAYHGAESQGEDE